MTSGYPGSVDNFNNPTPADNLSTNAVLHSSQHANVNDAVKAIETELGINPKGAAVSVGARIAAIEAAQGGFQLLSAKGANNGYAGLDGGGMLAQNVDAGKITAGTIAVARIPNLSGAKILGTGSGGALIPLDSVPNLPASQTTSGVFNIARIPDFDGAKITTGTVAAARLPSSVTSNANAKVVADVAGMNAIALVDRVDGMIVVVKQPWTIYAYRADNNTFVQAGGPGWVSEPVIQANDATDYLNVNSTSFTPGTQLGFTFKGPQSGRIMVGATVHGSNDTLGLFGYMSYEVRAGTTIGSGTLVHTATTEEAFAGGGAVNTRFRGTALQLMDEVLAQGSDYNIRAMYSNAGAVGTWDIFWRNITVIPVH